ncbi:hypothetical protein CR513_07311, partial [Mucuna pruriens]
MMTLYRLPHARSLFGYVDILSVYPYKLQVYPKTMLRLDHCMTRSSSNNLHSFDPEIDRTLHRLRKFRSTEVGNSCSFISISNSVNNTFTTNNFDFAEFRSFDINSKPNIADNTSNELDPVENTDRTLKELATPDVLYQPWCIQYSQLEPAQSYELKFGLIHLLPKFHGLAGEDMHKHLKEFHVVCSTMRPHGIPEDYIKMKVFPFSLDGTTKDWLYIQPVLFNTWGDMKRIFLENFFLASRTVTIWKDICGIRQHSGENLA